MKAIEWAAAAFCAALAVGVVAAGPGEACTRTLYVGAGDLVLTGRNMDWDEDMSSNLWIFPAGMARDGAAGPQSIKWTSRYGSVVVSSYEVGSADGLNEKGLVANLLYLANPTMARAYRAVPCCRSQPGCNMRWTITRQWPRRSTGSPPSLSNFGANAAERRRRIVASFHLRQHRRLGDLRISRRQARHSSRAAIYGDDQFAVL